MLGFCALGKRVLGTVLDNYSDVAFPQSNDCAVRVASNATAREYGVSYMQGHGNGLWLFNTATAQWEFVKFRGDGLPYIDTTDCTIDGVANQAMAPATRYYIYGRRSREGPGWVEIDHSVTPPQPGDPFGVGPVTGYSFKSDGTRNQRLLGAVETDPEGVIWRAGTRGVYHDGIGSYFHPQTLNLHIKPTGGHGSTEWQEIDAAQYLAAFQWGDGAGDGREPAVTLTGSVSSDTDGAIVSVGVSMNGENPPFDFVDVTCATAGNPYPFAITVICGNLPDGLVYYEIWMKNSVGNGQINPGATFTLHVSH